jgi:hypothetical protein
MLGVAKLASERWIFSVKRTSRNMMRIAVPRQMLQHHDHVLTVFSCGAETALTAHEAAALLRSFFAARR